MIIATPPSEASGIGQAIIGKVTMGLRALGLAMIAGLVVLLPLSGTALADPSTGSFESTPVGSSMITIGD